MVRTLYSAVYGIMQCVARNRTADPTILEQIAGESKAVSNTSTAVNRS